MAAEIREIFTKRQLPENGVDDKVGDILECMVNDRFDKESPFEKAHSILVIFEYKDENGESRYGQYCSNQKRTELLWAIECFKIKLMQD